MVAHNQDSENKDPRVAWERPARPEWVQRINEEGDCMDISGVVPLDEGSLLESARRATGLSDFGDDDWREPFQIYVKSLEKEADFNLMGRLRTRSEILYLLQAGLKIADAYRRHPEIEHEEITQPLIIAERCRARPRGVPALSGLLWISQRMSIPGDERPQ